jgi:hypothetical protein
MITKQKYRINNWKEYNKSLIQRGSITVWFSDDAIDQWLASQRPGKKGRPFTYSDDAILTALLLRAVFHLPLRALQGFMMSLVMLMNIAIPIPYYTQICKRAKVLGQELALLSKKNVRDIVIDSTGLKVYGEGEWKVRKHGYSKRRTWKKLHLAVCPDSHDILLEVLTDNSTSDCEVYPDFLAKTPASIQHAYGDGAYDTQSCYEASYLHGLSLIVPPQRNAVFHPDAPHHMEARNNAILEIQGLGGDDDARKLWKKLKDYHRRSLSETAMFRFKRLFGDHLVSHRFENQKAEVWAKCLAMNRMSALGMPDGEWITI